MSEKELREVPRSVREQYEKAVAATQRNNLDYAIAILNAVLSQEPGLYQAREALRDAQLRKAGNRGGFFRKVFGTASASPLLAKAQIALHTHPVQALETAEQILNSDPQSVPAHKILAEAAIGLDFPKTAVLSLQIVYKNSPDREVALQLGELLARAGQSERAEKVLSELARTFPADPEILRVLKNVSAKRTLTEGGYEALEGGGGSYRDILRDKEEAVSLEQAQRAVKTEDVAARLLAENEARILREPENLRLLRSTAELHAQRHEYDQALAYYQRIIEAEGVAEPSLERVITETTLRKYDFEMAQLDTQAPEYAENLARLQEQRRQFELDQARRMTEKYPSDLQLRFDLGVLYFKAARFTEAIQEFQKAQSNPHKRMQALNYLGQCFAGRGLNDLAARTFQNALKEKTTFDEEKKELLYGLGCVLEKLGKAPEAIEQFKLIYEVDIGYRDVAAKVDAYYSQS